MRRSIQYHNLFAEAWGLYAAGPCSPCRQRPCGSILAGPLGPEGVCWLGVKLQRSVSGEDKNCEKRDEKSHTDRGDADAPAPQQGAFEGRKSG
jgi:hypothetical protein